MQKILRNGVFYFLILILALWLIQGTFLSNKPPKKLNFNEFIKDVEAGKVAHVKILDTDKVIEATYKNGSKVKSSYPENYDIAKKLLSSDVEVEVEHKNMLWLSVLLNVAPWILLFSVDFHAAADAREWK